MSWQRRTWRNAKGYIKHRTCMACGEIEITEWWRFLGPLKTERFSSDRRRVVLCDDCASALSRKVQS